MIKKIILGILFGVSLFATEYIGDYEFNGNTPIFSTNIYGDFIMRGNTYEAVTKCKYVSPVSSLEMCETATDKNEIFYNNKYLVKKLNYSSTILNFPSNLKKIKYVLLTWGGHINNYSYLKSKYNEKDNSGYDKFYNKQDDKHKYIYSTSEKFYLSDDFIDNNVKRTPANKIILKILNTKFNIEADKLYYKYNSRYFCKNEDCDDFERKRGVVYIAFKEFNENSDLVKMLNKKIKFLKEKNLLTTIKDLYATEGLDKSLGNFAGWNIIVVYSVDENSDNAKYKNISIYNGFGRVYKNYQDLNIDIKNLVLPKVGKINSKLAIGSFEGEKYNSGDYVLLNGYKLTEFNTNNNNIFDSYLSPEIDRIPYYNNNNGVDIDIFDTSSVMKKIRNDNPNNDSYDVKVDIHSDVEGVYIANLVFSTDLYIPDLCYKNLKYLNNRGDSVSLAQIGDSVNVYFEVLNKSPNTSLNSKIFVDYNDYPNIEYIPNSSIVKDVYKKPLKLKDNIYYNNLYVNNKFLENKEVIYGDFNISNYTGNDNTKISIQYGIHIKDLGIYEPKLYVSYEYKIGDNTLTYLKTPLKKCKTFINTLKINKKISQNFNVVNGNFTGNIDNLEPLYAQTANKDFNISVIHLNDDNSTLSSYTGIVLVNMVDNNSSNKCEDKNDLDEGKIVSCINTSIVKTDYKYPNIIKDAKFKIKYIKNTSCVFNGDLYQFTQCLYDEINDNVKNRCVTKCYCGSATSCANQAVECLKCIIKTDTENTGVICSKDNFSIHPYEYNISLAPSSPVKAGEEFNLKIDALDYEGNILNDYNQSVYIDDNQTAKINYTDLKAPSGTLQKINGDFINGTALIKLKYNEVGELNLTIKEIEGSEYSKVDSSDTTERFIKPDNVLIKFIPHHFKIESDFKNYNNNVFTYISNNDNMYAPLLIKIIPVNKDEVFTQNYKFYAKNGELKLYYDNFESSTANDKMSYLIDSILINSNPYPLSDANLTINIDKGDFETNGYFLKEFKVNFNRRYDKYHKPFNFSFNDIKFKTDEVNDSRNAFVNNQASFRYGILKIQNALLFKENQVTTPIYAKYINNKYLWVNNTQHINEMGDLIGYYPVDNINYEINSTAFTNGVKKLNIIIHHAPPYSVKVHFNIPSWLWFHPLAKTYQAPSASNLDCLTHPCVKINYYTSGNGWIGIGRFTNRHRPADFHIDLNDTNISKTINLKKVKKLFW